MQDPIITLQLIKDVPEAHTVQAMSYSSSCPANRLGNGDYLGRLAVGEAGSIGGIPDACKSWHIS